jgi:VanZ family protein
MIAIVGAYDEWHQTFTPNRDGNSSGDFVANLAGGAFGYCVVLWCKGKSIISLDHLARHQ